MGIWILIYVGTWDSRRWESQMVRNSGRARNRMCTSPDSQSRRKSTLFEPLREYIISCNCILKSIDSWIIVAEQLEGAINVFLWWSCSLFTFVGSINLVDIDCKELTWIHKDGQCLCPYQKNFLILFTLNSTRACHLQGKKNDYSVDYGEYVVPWNNNRMKLQLCGCNPFSSPLWSTYVMKLSIHHYIYHTTLSQTINLHTPLQEK